MQPKIFLTKSELWEICVEAVRDGAEKAVERAFANSATLQHEPLRHHFADEGPR